MYKLLYKEGQMNYLRITNKGEMEIEAITLMGATSKEGDQSKIGFFGSGNKYAITCLLRHNIHLQIFSGVKEYQVTCEPVLFRGQEYQKVLVNGLPTSLTTRMGPAWKPWMAIREFYCNAVDEGLLDFSEVSELQGPSEGETSIYIEVTPEIQDFLDNKGKYLNELQVQETVHTKYGTVDILDSSEGMRFRKNIACVTDTQKSLYSYNFEDININESRIISSDYTQYERIACALALSQDEAVIMNVIRNINDDSLLEHKALWNNMYCADSLSSKWEEVLLGMNTSVMPVSLSKILGAEESMGLIVLPDDLVAKIKRDLPSVPQYGSFDGESIEAVPSTEFEEEVQKVLKEIESWGYPRTEVHYRKFLQVTTLGQYHDGKVYLSVICPIELLMEVLFEEIVVHKEEGLGDVTRATQYWLVKQVISLQRRCMIKEADLKL